MLCHANAVRRKFCNNRKNANAAARTEVRDSGKLQARLGGDERGGTVRWPAGEWSLLG